MPILIQKFIRLLPARLTLYIPKFIGYDQYGFQYKTSVIDQILYSQWTPKVTMGKKKQVTVNLLFRDFEKGYSSGQHKCKTLNLV